jgi:hypothetical protein
MSSQSLNSTVYNAQTNYGFVSGSSGILNGLPPRDASDYTRRLKQRGLFREYSGNATAAGKFTVPVDFSIVQSNANRKTYQFGALICPGCTKSFPIAPLGT